MARLAAEYIYTLDRPDPIRNGYVEYDHSGLVTSVGECEDPSQEEIFLEGAIVPGFVNSHCHVELSYMWKLFRKGTGMAGFIDQINALRDTKSLQEKISPMKFDDEENKDVAAELQQYAHRPVEYQVES